MGPLLKQKNDRFIIDGEIVTFDGDVTSFSRLQKRINVENPSRSLIRRIGVYFYVFDILYLDGNNLTGIGLHFRKSILKKTIDFDNRIRFTIHRNAEGEAFLKEACKNKWEGLIAKKKTAPMYTTGAKAG